ncbi:unnamed protein product [Microthlaspi erraticum]|uniref:Uncharacterized protein n=1 Tax=Microthlaspi erraticum TaxID=1685480 RepID=A0A6D2JMT1_9BRAS|nr:unnamed protein product [Microthlaspi erraticum]
MQALPRNDPHRGDHHSSSRSNPGLKGLSLAGTGFRKEEATNSRHNSIEPRASSIERREPGEWSVPDGRLPSPDHDLPPSSLGGTEAKFGGANSSSIELGVKTRKVVFWSILEHMGHEEHGGRHGRSSTGHAKEEGRSHLEDQLDHPTRPTGRVPQLDRPSFNSIELEVKVKPEKCCFPLDFPLTLNLILLYLKALSHEKTTKL